MNRFTCNVCDNQVCPDNKYRDGDCVGTTNGFVCRARAECAKMAGGCPDGMQFKGDPMRNWCSMSVCRRASDTDRCCERPPTTTHKPASTETPPQNQQEQVLETPAREKEENF